MSWLKTNIDKLWQTWRIEGGRTVLRLIWYRIRAPFVRWENAIYVRTNHWEKKIEDILKKHVDAKGIVFMMPSVDWNLTLFQRPQQMSLALAQMGYLVFYLELWDLKTRYGIYNAEENIYRVLVSWDVFKKIEKPIAIAYTYNSQYLSYLDRPRVIYEYIDDLEVFPHDQGLIIKAHRDLLRTADVVVATAKHLHDEVTATRKDAILAPNGVDYNHFLPAREKDTTPPSKDLIKILKPGHHVIGYYGALANWFDYDLIKQVAQQRPIWDILLIGVDYDNSLLPSGVLDLPNIHWLGRRRYSELPNYLNHFDVATIPFKVNNITNSTSPLKMFEYFAGHKPVVATAMHEVQRYSEVLIAHNVQEFIKQTEKALTLKHDPEFITKLDIIARENTWEKRVEQILGAVSDS